MQETSNYNLKKPEPTDPLRLADFNENADIIDGAIKAVERSVAGAYGPNNLPWETGTIDMSAGEPGGSVKKFGFVPSAVIVYGASSHVGIACGSIVARVLSATDNGTILLKLQSSTLVLNGISGTTEKTLQYIALK